MAYVVEARLIGHGVSEVACKENVIAFDSSPASGPHLPGPAELLGAAFAACLLKNVERFSEILPFRQSGPSVRVELERQESPPRFTRIRYALHVATDEDEGRVALLHRNLKKHGTVFNTLDVVCEIEGEIVAERSLPR